MSGIKSFYLVIIVRIIIDLLSSTRQWNGIGLCSSSRWLFEVMQNALNHEISVMYELIVLERCVGPVCALEN
jgi:hypothetical protein